MKIRFIDILPHCFLSLRQRWRLVRSLRDPQLLIERQSVVEEMNRFLDFQELSFSGMRCNAEKRQRRGKLAV
jgi:hypothetical protein